MELKKDKVTASLFIKTQIGFMKASGNKMFAKAMALKYLLMGIATMESIALENLMDRGSIHGSMVKFMKENGEWVLNKATGSGKELSGTLTLVNGLIAKLMDTAFIFGKTVTNMKVSGKET